MAKDKGKKAKNLDIWLVIYILGSIPVLLFYAAGLSGWFFDYPLALFIFIFLILITAPLLLLLKFPKASQWNIAMLWIASLLIISRIIYGLLFQGLQNAERLLEGAAILIGVISFSILWAAVWTRYFRR